MKPGNRHGFDAGFSPAHDDPSDKYLYPHAARYAAADSTESQIPPEKVADYRMVRGLLQVLDILAPHQHA
jgi:hypothetical protein